MKKSLDKPKCPYSIGDVIDLRLPTAFPPYPPHPTQSYLIEVIGIKTFKHRWRIKLINRENKNKVTLTYPKDMVESPDLSFFEPCFPNRVPSQ